MSREFPSNINPNFHPSAKKMPWSVDKYLDGIKRGDRMVLGKAVTLIESENPKHQLLAHKLIEACLPLSGKSVRIGITGAPGVGKSTFIEAFGLHLLKCGKKIAVLAVDPTSTLTRGSILGDKTRMKGLSMASDAFVRPSSAGQSLGGVAAKTREAIILFEAAGYDVILVETVGVGQSQHAVHSMTDLFLLLLLPGAGDELQGIKRGIVEMADLLVINKADKAPHSDILYAQRAYTNALKLLAPKKSTWDPVVTTCSSTEGSGLFEIWGYINTFYTLTAKNGYLEENRKNQAKFWFEQLFTHRLKELFLIHPQVKAHYESLEREVLEQRISPFQAADLLLAYFKS